MSAGLRRFAGREQLGREAYVAGPEWTVADATTLCAVDFAGWTDVKIPPEYLQRW